MNNKPVLEMNNIVKKFPGVIALDNVSIKLYEGELLSLCGENGAGKSTLMKILSGEYACDTYDGNIHLNDKKVKITSNKYAEKKGISMIYQEISVELDLSVAENILLGCLPTNKFKLVDWKKAYEMSKEVLSRIGLDIDVRMNMRLLGASVQQLVCIARALIRNPRILILDEPTAALTEVETENLLNVIHNLKAQGISCIYISHKLEEVFRISDRIVVMRDAKVVSEYKKGEFVPEKIIEDMIGRKLENLYPDMSNRKIGEVVLDVKNLKVKHPSSTRNIIEDVSFSLRKGEVLGLGGLVGSGRSELVRAVFGALPRLKGTIHVNGEQVNILSPQQGIEKGLGFLTEERKKDGIINTMDIGENMTLSILQKISKSGVIHKKTEEDNVNKYFNYLKVKAPSSKTSITNLSGGNQQKVVLAKSLLTNVHILFLDEPTRGIDIGAKTEIYKLIKSLSDDGVSIVMISSEYPELVAMCDRHIILSRGKVVSHLDRSETTEAKLIKLASFKD